MLYPFPTENLAVLRILKSRGFTLVFQGAVKTLEKESLGQQGDQTSPS